MNPWLKSTVDNYKQYFGESANPIVWDVGSRDGKDGVELAERIHDGNPKTFWDDATVVCIEANPKQAKIIKKNYPKAIVHEIAVSNKIGKAKFIVYEGNEGDVGSSSLNLDWKKDSNLKSHIITVSVTKLDKLIKDEQIDIMKIDVEGYSLQALKGMGKKLRQVKVFHIETENDTGSYGQVKEFMASSHYKLVDEMEQWGGQPDLVFVRAEKYLHQYIL